MKVLKIVGAIILIILIIPIFGADKIEIKRNIKINSNPKTVFRYVYDFNEFAKWNEWSRMEPEAKITISENGNKYSWEGSAPPKGIGSGYLQHKEAEDGIKIVNDLFFISPQEGKATTRWAFNPTSNGTKVEWSYEQESNYMYNLVSTYGIFKLETILGPMLQKGLENLKELVETNPTLEQIQVDTNATPIE